MSNIDNKTLDKPKTTKVKSKSNANKLKVGRKSKYETHVKPYLHLITQWCKNGSTEAQIYKKLKVGKDGFYNFKKKYKELAEALKIGKDDADDLVESALYKRAVGYSFDEVKEEYDGDILIKKTVVRKQEVPDTTAQIFWLKNRRPDRWRNNDRLEISNNNTDVHNAVLASLKQRETANKIKEAVEEINNANE